jgi:hypothetical protein
MSARAVVPGVAELAENSKFEAAEFAGAVTSDGVLPALAGDAIAGELPLAGFGAAFCPEGLAAGLAAVLTAGVGTSEATGADLATDGAGEPLPESPSKNLAAAVKSEKVATLNRPAACAVAPAAGVCADEVNSSAAGAEVTGVADDFEALDPCAVVGVPSAELCSACGWD